jgi:hypothetical protein
MSAVAAVVPALGSGAPGSGCGWPGSQSAGGWAPAAGSGLVPPAGSGTVPQAGSAGIAGTGATVTPGHAEPLPAAGTPRQGRGRGERLTAAQRLAIAAITLTTLGLAAYGAAASYVSVRHLAATHHMPLAALVPIDIDGGLAGTVALDLVLAWTGYPLAWLRALARLFVAGTVAANLLAGWPDPVSVGLHAAPPLLFLMFVEAARSVLLRAGSDSTWREPVPAARWLMAPWPTFLLWRRMVLWRIHSYAEAVDLELSRRQAIIRLIACYGPAWRDHAPGDLVWMLRHGVRLAEACARVAKLTTAAGEGGAGEPGPPGRSRHRAGTRGRAAPGNRAGTRPGNRAGTRPGNRAGTRPGNHGELLAVARRAAADHLATSGREITVAELALALGRRKQLAGELMRQIRAATAAEARAAAQARTGGRPEPEAAP